MLSGWIKMETYMPENVDGQISAHFLDELNALIQSRKSASAESSYTASLLHKGKEKCAKKFGEEAIEFALAMVSEDDEALIGEAGDVLYHLLVALAARDVEFSAVINILKSRTHQSGHAEKASRVK